MEPPSAAMRDLVQIIDNEFAYPDPARAASMADLRGLLSAIRKLDPSRTGNVYAKARPDECYPQRNLFVIQAVAVAMACGFRSGFVADWEEPEGWVIAYIDLPTGQISFHLPTYPDVFDGHDTDEKYARIQRFCHDPEQTAGSGS